MHPNTSSRSTSLGNPFRRGVLIVALTAALTAVGCARPPEPPPPATPGPMASPELNLHDCEDLMVGDRTNSNCVTALQRLLNTRGAQLPLVGIFNERTLDRVLQFQAARELPETGTVGNLTKNELYKYPPLGEEWNLRTECVDLYGGAEGQCVQSLQHLLAQYGKQVADNGKYGPETTEAVRRFQRDHKLPEDGVTDSRTKEELYGQLSSVAPSDWRAEADDCPGPNCRVSLDHATVASVVKNFDTGAVVREVMKDLVIQFACTVLLNTLHLKAAGLQVACEGTINFFIGLFREAQAGQKCVQVSFKTTSEDSRPTGLDQTERCPT